MRTEVMRGSLETRINLILQRCDGALSPEEIASAAGREVQEIYETLEAMYWSSKLEKKNGRPPIYRIPGKGDGKLSLPN